MAKILLEVNGWDIEKNTPDQEFDDGRFGRYIARKKIVGNLVRAVQPGDIAGTGDLVCFTGTVANLKLMVKEFFCPSDPESQQEVFERIKA